MVSTLEVGQKTEGFMRVFLGFKVWSFREAGAEGFGFRALGV